MSGDAKFDAAPVEQFALSDYLLGLATMKGVPPPGDPFIARVASMIGRPFDIVRRERGWSARTRCSPTSCAAIRTRCWSLYDATIARASPANPWDQTAGDPILDNSIAAYTAAFNAYAPDGLGYHSDLQYHVLPHIWQQWNFDGTREGEDGLGLALSGLQTALLDHPATKILIANGRYDLVTPYFGSRWLVDQLGIPEAVRQAIRVKVYEGGHMMYLRARSREALAADVAALFAAR